jgi:hypothetical protein
MKLSVTAGWGCRACEACISSIARSVIREIVSLLTEAP